MLPAFFGGIYVAMRGFFIGSVGKESACNAGDAALIPGLGRFPGVENNNPLQYSCQKNHVYRGTWGVFKELGMTERLCMHAHMLLWIKGVGFMVYSKNVLFLQSPSSMQLKKIPLGFLSCFFLQGPAAVCYKYLQVYFKTIWREAGKEGMAVLSLCSLEMSLRKVF